MNKKDKIEKVKTEYGVDPRELCDLKEAREMIERVSIYHKLKKAEDTIDSITWNDLEMDEVFHRVNHTRSYAGEQVLYHVLHGAINPTLGIGPNEIRLKELLQRLQHDVDEVIIALPNASYRRINAVIDTCEFMGVKTQIIPDYFNLVRGSKPAFVKLPEV